MARFLKNLDREMTHWGKNSDCFLWDGKTMKQQPQPHATKGIKTGEMLQAI
jgi:hypothetical protein